MFLPCPGESAMPFDMWLRVFNNYLLVINATGDAWPDIHKRATLLHCLGTEGQQIFYTLPHTGDTYASAVSAIEKHFTPKVNVVVEPYAFRKRAQFPHETIAQYVQASCGFEDKSDDMICDQLLEHFLSDSIRERLLLESDLTLDTAITLAAQMEAAADQQAPLKVLLQMPSAGPVIKGVILLMYLILFRPPLRKKKIIQVCY
uniref:Uncharacterized protein n=1 Tax=Cyprinus carpio TaxID=7962 RepID=A0A8C1UM80_CYPCA